MGMPVVIAATGGLPVVVATNGLGVPCTIATNGFGVRVTQSANGIGLPVAGVTFGPSIVLTGNTVLENSAVNTVVGALTMSGTTGTPAYALTDSAGGRFKLVGSSLQVAAATIDFETATSHNVTVSVSGVAPAVSATTFTIVVLDVTLAVPAAPTLTLTSANTDTTPDFTLAGDLIVGDTVRFQYSTSSDFAGASELTNTIDAAEDTANAITFTTGALALGTWYFRARIERPDASASGDWSNVVTDTIIVAPTATTWNPSDKTAGLTLSNVNRTISHPTGGNTNEAIRSVAPVAAGQKVYVEYTIGAKTTAFTFGFCTIGTALAGPSSGYATPSTSFAFSTNGNLRCQDAPDDTIAHIASFTVGDRIGIAFNATTLRAWARKNGGAWNDIKGGAQDPVAGTGGALVPSMGTLYAFCGLDANNGDAVTANFATANWVDAVPSGFTQLA